MKVGNHHDNQESEEQQQGNDVVLHGFACHLRKLTPVKLVRDPISVGIDPVRELSSVYFVVVLEL